MNALVSQESSALERYMSEVKRIPMLSREEEDTLARCFEALRGQPLRVASTDPRLRAQTRGVQFVDPAGS